MTCCNRRQIWPTSSSGMSSEPPAISLPISPARCAGSPTSWRQRAQSRHKHRQGNNTRAIQGRCPMAKLIILGLITLVVVLVVRALLRFRQAYAEQLVDDEIG